MDELKPLRVSFDILVPVEIGEGLALRENVHEATLAFLRSQHLSEALEWMVRPVPGDVPVAIWEANRRKMVKYHQEWANILSFAKFDVIEIEEA